MSKTARTPAPKAASASTPAPGTAPASKPAARPIRRARIDVDQASAAKPQPPVKTASKAAKPAVSKATKPATPSRSKSQSAKRLSALDAAAQLLASLNKSEAATGITAPDLIERMAKAKLWTSPGGKTPAATLYAAMIREITKKGAASRFKRIAPGRFVAGAAAKTRTITGVKPAPHANSVKPAKPATSRREVTA